MPSKKSSAPTWDLSDLFKNIADPQIEKLLTRQFARAELFAKNGRGKITDKLAPEKLLAMIQEYESILEQSYKPLMYAELIFSADSKNPKLGAFLQKMQTRVLAITQQMVFFEVELSRLSESVLTRLAKDKTLAPYAHYLSRVADFRPHRLNEREEQLMNELSLTGRTAFSRLFDEELAHKTFEMKTGRSTKSYSEEELLHHLHSPKREERKHATETLTNGLNEESRRLTYITNTLLQDKATKDKILHFETPEDSQHLANETTRETVKAMTDAITARYGIVKDYYLFKRKLLKLPKLFDYDRYAPITTQTRVIPFEEAKRIVLDAYASFSPKFAEIAKLFFDKHWIDAELRPGKRGGAFCSFITTDLHPYLFVNYQGGVRDVFTLAHELGHAVHAYLARKQTFLNFDMPLTFAETASVFGEMLVFDYLRTHIENPKEKLGLYTQKIDEIFATVFRQTAMHRFEQDIHGAWRTQGELPTSAINKFWHTRQQEMFGTSVIITPGHDIWWSYIPHFIHTPFYVYAYAFGEILTLALFAQYKKQGPAVVKNYFTMLESGGSKTPSELLAPFNIKLTDKKFWDAGLDLVEEIVGEMKGMA